MTTAVTTPDPDHTAQVDALVAQIDRLHFEQAGFMIELLKLDRNASHQVADQLLEAADNWHTGVLETILLERDGGDLTSVFDSLTIGVIAAAEARAEAKANQA